MTSKAADFQSTTTIQHDSSLRDMQPFHQVSLRSKVFARVKEALHILAIGDKPKVSGDKLYTAAHDKYNRKSSFDSDKSDLHQDGDWQSHRDSQGKRKSDAMWRWGCVPRWS